MEAGGRIRLPCSRGEGRVPRGRVVPREVSGRNARRQGSRLACPSVERWSTDDDAGGRGCDPESGAGQAMTTGSAPSSTRAYQINLAGWALFMLVFGGATATVLQAWLQRQAAAGPAVAVVVEKQTASPSAVTPPTPIPPTVTNTARSPTSTTVDSVTPSMPSAASAAAAPATTIGSATPIVRSSVSAATSPARATPSTSHANPTVAPASRADCLQACVDKCKDDANCERSCAARCAR